MIDKVITIDMKIKDVGEIGLIARIAKGLRYDKSVVLGVGDDTAVIKWTKDKYLLYTCDMLVEDVHFRLAGATPFRIGRKAISRNISDIAAMGGVPRYAVVSIGIDPEMPVSFIDGIYKGIKSIADRFKINLVGGDMSKSSKLVIDISLLGEVEANKLVTRSGAKAGDMIFVTGSIGGSIKGKHLDFIPRVEEARAIVRDFRMNSMVDISDGLILDLSRILLSSGVGARIYENAIPVSVEADSFESAVKEGEDFELLFTMSSKEAKRFLGKGLIKMPIPVTLIGEILDKRHGFTLVSKDGSENKIKAKGYRHF